MLTAMASVDNIIAGITDKSGLWKINTEQEYHEKKESDSVPPPERKVEAPVTVGAVGQEELVSRK